MQTHRGTGPAATSIAEVVAADLCVGCGLCEAVTSGRVPMVITPTGSLRPSSVDEFTPDQEAAVLAACPGAIATPREEADVPVDEVWGAWRSMRYAWAADPDVRFRAATGGALTALGASLLRRGEVAFVLHVGADPDRPMRSRWVISERPEEVLANTGSRYGPTAPLAGLGVALDRGEPFAAIAKPCDLGALHAYASVDRRVDELCVARLALVCGGQSKLTKSQAVLSESGIAETEVTLFRYRGHGNPGPTRVETTDGRVIERSYLSMWEDESGWDLQTRCKLCPDALGEAADVAAADVWPGGAPTGEDEGFNGIIVRTAAGDRLVDAAVAAGDLVVGSAITPRQFDDFQPHQVRKKVALAARYAGRADVGQPNIAAPDLRLDRLGERLDPLAWDAERAGAERRFG